MDNKVDSGVNFLLVRSGKMEIQLYFLSRDCCLDCYFLFGDVYARFVFSCCLYENILERTFSRGLNTVLLRLKVTL